MTNSPPEPEVVRSQGINAAGLFMELDDLKNRRKELLNSLNQLIDKAVRAIFENVKSVEWKKDSSDIDDLTFRVEIKFNESIDDGKIQELCERLNINLCSWGDDYCEIDLPIDVIIDPLQLVSGITGEQCLGIVS